MLTLNWPSKRFNGPEILGFLMAKYVAFAVIQQHAEISKARSVPPILDFTDFKYLFVQVYPQRALVGSMPGVAFHAEKRRPRRCWPRRL
jgi:hypothetical protein